MIKGTVIELGGQKFVMPPMNVMLLQQHEEFFKGAANGTLGAGDMFGRMDVICDIVHKSLRRNYKEIDEGFVRENVDIGNMEELLGAAVKTSGLTDTVPAGEPAPGAGQTGTA